MFSSFNITRFVAIVYGVLIVGGVSSQCHAEDIGRWQYNQRLTYSQDFLLAASSKRKVNPLARLRNDGRPFTIHVAPSRYSFVAADLYPLTRFVQLLGRCTGRWCYVRHGNVVGWLSTDRFLRDPSGSPALLSRTIETVEVDNNHEQTAEPHKGDVKVVETEEDHEKVAEIDENRIKVVEIALPVRKGLVPPRGPSVPDGPTLAAAQLVPPQISHIEPKKYALKELGGRLFLPVQEDRSENSRIQGTLPFFASDVEALGECIGEWCLIRRGSLQGWIRQRHLTDEPQITDPQLQLEAIMPVDALNIYSAPNKLAKLIAKIEPPVADIKPLEKCDEKWCYIRHSDIVGWVEPRYLTRQ